MESFPPGVPCHRSKLLRYIPIALLTPPSIFQAYVFNAFNEMLPVKHQFKLVNRYFVCFAAQRIEGERISWELSFVKVVYNYFGCASLEKEIIMNICSHLKGVLANMQHVELTVIKASLKARISRDPTFHMIEFKLDEKTAWMTLHVDDNAAASARLSQFCSMLRILSVGRACMGAIVKPGRGMMWKEKFS